MSWVKLTHLKFNDKKENLKVLFYLKAYPAWPINVQKMVWLLYLQLK